MRVSRGLAGNPPRGTAPWPEPRQARHNTATRITPREAAHMSTGIGARVPRKEDARHLAGKAQFVGDLSFPRLWEVLFARSRLAHARIRSVTVPPTTKPTGGTGAQRNCRPVERRVSSQLFAPDALVHGARPCAQILSPTLSMPHTCAGCRCHAWQRTPAHAFAFLQRLDHYASSSPISSSGEHSTGQAKPKSDTALITIVRVLALLICLKFQVIR